MQDFPVCKQKFSNSNFAAFSKKALARCFYLKHKDSFLNDVSCQETHPLKCIPLITIICPKHVISVDIWFYTKARHISRSLGLNCFSQAAAVLNWNPIHIKTRTVEKTLEPLVLQVTTLVSSSANGKQQSSKNFQFLTWKIIVLNSFWKCLQFPTKLFLECSYQMNLKV